MTNTNDFIIDEETIRKVGLHPSNKDFNASVAPNARVFEYPGLENVYVMESDLYGNAMPKDSCFLAFYGRNGLLGTEIKIDILKRASVEDIRKIVEKNSAG